MVKALEDIFAFLSIFEGNLVSATPSWVAEAEFIFPFKKSKTEHSLRD
jgi:hypothetical protein